MAGRSRGFLKVKAAYAMHGRLCFWDVQIFDVSRCIKNEAGIFTCLFFRYKDAVFKMTRNISLLYDIGLDATHSEVLRK
jgi:hypothetical protein